MVGSRVAGRSVDGLEDEVAADGERLKELMIDAESFLDISESSM
jgi:hypothetical protein